MWKLVLGIILANAYTSGQVFQDLLLPEWRHIVGVIVDEEGKPVAEARIEHTNDREILRAGLNGRFVLDTKAPAVVIRKAGFRSQLVRTREATDVRIALQRLTEPRAFPSCSSNGRFEGIDGWSALFRFPRISGVKSSPQGHDIDYGVRNYYVDTRQGPIGIRHGSGPSWSYGLPLDRYVWRSIQYEETTFDAAGLPIIDARGQFPNGNRWRNLGRFGESASYSDIDEVTAKILDRFLDGACLKSAPGR